MDLILWVNVSPSNLLVDLVSQTRSLILAVPSLVPDVLLIECRYLDYRVTLAGRLDIPHSSIELGDTHTYISLHSWIPVLLFWRKLLTPWLSSP